MINSREIVRQTASKGAASGNLSRTYISDTVRNVVREIPYRNARLGGRGLKRAVVRRATRSPRIATPASAGED